MGLGRASGDPAIRPRVETASLRPFRMRERELDDGGNLLGTRLAAASLEPLRR